LGGAQQFGLETMPLGTIADSYTLRGGMELAIGKEVLASFAL